MFEIMADCGKMWDRLIDGDAQKPAIGHVHIDLFQSSAKRRQSINVLNKDDLKKDHRINAWSAIIFTVKIFHEIIDPVKINGSIYFTKKMVFWNHGFETDEFNNVTFIRIFS